MKSEEICNISVEPESYDSTKGNSDGFIGVEPYSIIWVLYLSDYLQQAAVTTYLRNTSDLTLQNFLSCSCWVSGVSQWCLYTRLSLRDPRELYPLVIPPLILPRVFQLGERVLAGGPGAQKQHISLPLTPYWTELKSSSSNEPTTKLENGGAHGKYTERWTVLRKILLKCQNYARYFTLPDFIFKTT